MSERGLKIEQPAEKTTNQMRRELEAGGYRFVIQDGRKPDDAESVAVDGERVPVPFTNGILEVILKPEGGSWQYVARGEKDSEDFNRELKIVWELEFEDQE